MDPKDNSTFMSIVKIQMLCIPIFANNNLKFRLHSLKNYPNTFMEGEDSKSFAFARTLYALLAIPFPTFSLTK